MGTKISELAESAAPDIDDLFAVVVDGVTKKVTVLNVLKQLSQSVAYTNSIPFSAPFTKVGNHTMTANVTFDVDSADAIPGAVTSLRLTGDGSHDVSFDGIKVIDGSNDFDPTDDVVNLLLFYYDGTDYWVNIKQEKANPVLLSATVEDAAPDQLILTYNKTLDDTSEPDPAADYNFSDGRTGTAIDITGAVVNLTVDTPYENGDTITLDYTAGANPIKDLAGHLAADLTAQAVENNIGAGEPSEVDLIPVDLVNMDESPTGTWNAINLVTGWNHHCQFQQKLPAGEDGYVEAEFGSGVSLAFGLMDADDVGNYATIDFGAFTNTGTFWVLPSASDSGIGYAAGDKTRLKRVSGTVSLVRNRAGVEMTINTFAGTHNGDLFIKAALSNEDDTFIEPKGLAVVDK